MKFILSLAAVVICISVYGGDDHLSEISRLRAELPKQDEDQRLQTLLLIYEHSYAFGDPDIELAALYPYLNEAVRQRNVQEESYALIQRICFFYNNGMGDSLSYYCPSTMEFMRRNARWGGYYFTALLNIKFELCADRTAQALSQAQSPYDEARPFTAAGRSDEAAAVYEEALIYVRQLMDSEISSQVEEMGHRVESDRLNSRTRTRDMIFLIGLFSLLIVFCLYIFYSRRLRIKNRVLSGQLKEMSRLRAWQFLRVFSDEPADTASEDNSGNEKPVYGNGRNKSEEMVWLACRKIAEDKKFCDPALNRKHLADLLGTNENYLASAIREVNDGQTVGDFINEFRLDYACILITERPNMTLDAIAHDSGLVTRSTLFRLFLKKFGMSPSEYRSQHIKNQRTT